MPPKPKSPKLTHFLCIPLVTPTSRPQLQQSLSTFKTSITSPSSPSINPPTASPRIPEKAVRPVGTLHLTLGVMSLTSQDEVDRALSVLKGLDLRGMLESVSRGEEKDDKGQDSIVEKPLTITLRGLQSMHDPSKTSVLYSAPFDPHQRLLEFCTILREPFLEADLMVEEKRDLLLHATILNTVYVPGVREKGRGYGRDRGRLMIDARDIIEKYREFEWMKDIRVEKVAICRMGARRVEGGEDEEYVREGEVDMP